MKTSKALKNKVMDELLKILIPDSTPKRYERKFYISKMDAKEVECLIKIHPSAFSEIFHERFVNNIYLDSVGLKHYFDNIDGNNRRYKIRFRWYGNLLGHVGNPVLEVKVKENLVGFKLRYPFGSFEVGPELSMEEIGKVCKHAGLPDAMNEILRGMNFSLLNRYRRKYFLSADKKYRITIDSDLGYYSLAKRGNTFLNKNSDVTGVVVELKYDTTIDDEAKFITHYFPFRLSRMSKYVSGVESFCY